MKSFNINNQYFRTQKDLDAHIKNILSKLPRNKEIQNDFLLELINNYHSDVIKRKLNITKLKVLDWEGQVGEWGFCRDRFRGNIFIIGFFEPISLWHGVTIYPHKRNNNSIKNKLILSLRQKWSENIKKRELVNTCEKCGKPYPVLHHDSKSFKDIVDICLKEFTEDELKNGIGVNWWLHETEADALSDTHPAVLKLFELHKKIKYKWLCKDCHKREHGFTN